MIKLRNRKGQSTLEYVLIAAAVITLVVILIQKMNTPAKARIDEISKGLNQSTQ
jgi:hypothetical protein